MPNHMSHTGQGSPFQIYMMNIAGIHERSWHFKYYYFILPFKGIYTYTISWVFSKNISISSANNDNVAFFTKTIVFLSLYNLITVERTLKQH